MMVNFIFRNHVNLCAAQQMVTNRKKVICTKKTTFRRNLCCEIDHFKLNVCARTLVIATF